MLKMTVVIVLSRRNELDPAQNNGNNHEPQSLFFHCPLRPPIVFCSPTSSPAASPAPQPGVLSTRWANR